MLQIGDKSDSVSVDRLKPVYSTVPVDPAVPISRGRSRLVPPTVSVPPDPVCPSKKKVCFAPPAPAPQKSSSNGLRFSASLRRPPASPCGGSNCGNYDDLFAASLLQSRTESLAALILAVRLEFDISFSSEYF